MTRMGTTVTYAFLIPQQPYASPAAQQPAPCNSKSGVHWKRMDKYGWHDRLHGRFRGLGQFDAGGDFAASDFAGPVGGDPIGGSPTVDYSSLDFSTGLGPQDVQPGGQFFQQVDTIDPSQPGALPPQDTGWTTDPTTGGVVDNSSGITYFGDGSINYPDGSYYDATSGIYYDATTGQYTENPFGGVPAGTTGQIGGDSSSGSGGSGSSSGSGGGSSSGGGRSGGGSGGGSAPRSSGSQQPQQQSILCLFNPAACQAKQPAVKPATSATSSVTNFLSANAPWLILAGAVVFVLPSLLPAPSGRR